MWRVSRHFRLLDTLGRVYLRMADPPRRNDFYPLPLQLSQNATVAHLMGRYEQRAQAGCGCRMYRLAQAEKFSYARNPGSAQSTTHGRTRLQETSSGKMSARSALQR